MPELIRSLAARLREYIGNNRRAPRREARLHVSVTPLDVRARPSGARPSSLLNGYTRDLSITGLGLVLPAIHIGGHYLTGEGRKLQIALDLPPGTVQLNAAPVRYERLEESGAEPGYMIGARITEINPRDRQRFVEYLRTIR